MRNQHSGYVIVLLAAALVTLPLTTAGQGNIFKQIQKKLEETQKAGQATKGKQVPKAQVPAGSDPSNRPANAPATGAAPAAGRTRFDSVPEPDHQALFKLYMAVNGDVLDTDRFATDNHLLFHTAPQGSAECTNLGLSARNEVTAQNLLAQFRAELRKDLVSAQSWPKTAVFRIRSPMPLNTYDPAKQAFHVDPNLIAWGSNPNGINIAIRKTLLGPLYYPGPAGDQCTSAVRLGSGAIVQFALVVRGTEKIQGLPMGTAEAERFIGEIQRDRRIILEYLIETEPSIPVAPRARIPARMVAARALHPKTNAVLHNYDLLGTPTVSQGNVEPAPRGSSPTASQAKAAPASGGQIDPLTYYDATLVFLRDNPRMLTDERLIAAATEQIYLEQTAWEHADYAVSRRNEPRARGKQGFTALRNPNPKRALFTYEWQHYSERNDPLAAKELLGVFRRPTADWGFVTRDPQWDDRFEAIALAFIFSREKIDGREAPFAAREVASTFKKHLQAAAAAEPSTFQFDVQLQVPTYDFNSGAFKFTFQEDGGTMLRELKPAEISYRPPSPGARGNIFVVPEALRTAVLYLGYGYKSSFRLSEPREVKPGVASSNAAPTPTSSWRSRTLGGAGKLPNVSTLGFDRRLILPPVPLESGRAESLVKAMQTTGGKWYARLLINDAHGVPAQSYNERGEVSDAGIVVSRVAKIDVFGPGDQLVASIGPASLPAPAAAAAGPAPRAPGASYAALSEAPPQDQNALQVLVNAYVKNTAFFEPCTPTRAKSRAELAAFLSKAPQFIEASVKYFDQIADLSLRAAANNPNAARMCRDPAHADAIRKQYAREIESSKQWFIRRHPEVAR